MARAFMITTFALVFMSTTVGSQRHIVFIVVDDLGWNDIGFHNPDIISPIVDKLAKQGVILDHAYVQPLCSPSRAAFMTGYYPYRLGLQHLVILPPQAVCVPGNVTFLPEVLKTLGYSTHIVGKWHLGYCNLNCTPTFRGFDSFLGYYNAQEDYYNRIVDHYYDFRDNITLSTNENGTYSTFVFQERVRQIIAAHDPSKPLFLYLPLQSVHVPLEVPKQYYDMYPKLKTEDRRIFSGMVTAMDDVIGNLTSYLKQRGMYNDTLFFFTADNGGFVQFGGSNWPLRGGKYTLWEGGTRAVSFVSGAGLKHPGTTFQGLMHAVDWMPTIIAAAGGDVTDQDIDGMNLWDAISNGGPSPRSEFIYNLDDMFIPAEGHAAIRQGDYKLIVGLPGAYSDWYPPDQPLDPAQSGEAMAGVEKTLTQLVHKNTTALKSWNDVARLYNIIEDPTERHNLADKMSDMVDKLKLRMSDYKKKYTPPNYPAFDPAADPDKHDGNWSPGWC